MTPGTSFYDAQHNSFIMVVEIHNDYDSKCLVSSEGSVAVHWVGRLTLNYMFEQARNDPGNPFILLENVKV